MIIITVFMCVLFPISLSIDVSVYNDDDYFFVSEGMEPTVVGKTYSFYYKLNDTLEMVIHFVNIPPGSQLEVIETHYQGNNIINGKRTNITNKYFMKQQQYVISKKSNFSAIDITIQLNPNSNTCERKTIISGYLTTGYTSRDADIICIGPNACAVVVDMKNECAIDGDTQKYVLVALFSTTLGGIVITLLSKSITSEN